MDISLLQKALLPGIVMLGAFILIVLYLAGMIETALQMFSSPVSVSISSLRTLTIYSPTSMVHATLTSSPSPHQASRSIPLHTLNSAPSANPGTPSLLFG